VGSVRFISSVYLSEHASLVLCVNREIFIISLPFRTSLFGSVWEPWDFYSQFTFQNKPARFCVETVRFLESVYLSEHASLVLCGNRAIFVISSPLRTRQFSSVSNSQLFDPATFLQNKINTVSLSGTQSGQFCPISCSYVRIKTIIFQVYLNINPIDKISLLITTLLWVYAHWLMLCFFFHLGAAWWLLYEIICCQATHEPWRSANRTVPGPQGER
jgi:hypothetical protein